MRCIKRTSSIITGKATLEHLFTFKNFPVSMGCTDEPATNDVKADMSFGICTKTGIIQLEKLLPLDIVYQNQHNDGIGKIWQEHYHEFSSFLSKFKPKKILEIGGANDFIANNFISNNPNTLWIDVEPHPLFKENHNIKIIRKWFDQTFTTSEATDTVVHSHVLEHTYQPVEFIKHIASFLKPNQMHIFTIPNMVKQLTYKYTNCLNFEHTVFLAEPLVDHILQECGFIIIDKKYFQDHSIFYATKKITTPLNESKPVNKYIEYKQLFNQYINYHLELVKDLNGKIDNFEGDVYLFGGHIFSQYLIAFGLNSKKVKYILDNSDIKNNKRLYGTNLIVRKPEIIKGINNVAVILKVGAYRNEILSQLKLLNKNVTIFE